MNRSSKESIDFIVRQEVTSPAYYARHYRRPEWPGASSGITVACGYDLGYASPEKIRRDWTKYVSADMLQTMIHCSGVKGQEAKALLPKVKSLIDIPWSAAFDVFENSDIPQWEGAIARAVPNTDKISSLCFGMLVSTGYNRGAGGFTSNAPRFAEMRNIRSDLGNMDLKPIGSEFLSMRRLWPTLKGLQDRYTETATLWNRGIDLPITTSPEVTIAPPVEHDGEHPLNAGPARTKPPATTPAQHTVTAAIVTASGGAATQAAQSGVPTYVVAAIVVFGIVVAASVWFAWYKNRNP